MYLVQPLSWDKGSGRYTWCLPCSPSKFLRGRGKGGVSTRYVVSRGWLYQIHCQSIGTHGGKHRSGMPNQWFFDPKTHSGRPTYQSELFAMGPVKFSWHAEWPKLGMLNQGLGSILLVFLGKTAKQRVHWIFFSSDPWNSPNLIFWDWPQCFWTTRMKKSRLENTRESRKLDPPQNQTFWGIFDFFRVRSVFCLQTPQKAGIANGGVPGRGFSNSWTCCVFFACKSAIAKEFLLKIDTSLTIAMSGLRTNLLFEKPPFRKPPIRFSPPKKRLSLSRGAANGGLRDGGLSKSEDILGKRPFSFVFWISQVLFVPSGKGRKRQKKGEKGRFWPISRKGGQTPLKPPFVTPPKNWLFLRLFFFF